MKAAIKIPKGWRRVPAADIRKGDRWLCTLGGFCWAKYQPQYGVVAYCVCTVIRRTQRPKKWAPKGYSEITATQFYARFDRHESSMRFSPLKGRRLMTYTEWMADKKSTAQTMETTRFWLRRGAK